MLDGCFFLSNSSLIGEEFDKKSSRRDAHKTRKECAKALAFWRAIRASAH